MSQRAVILSGSIGLGHDVVSETLTASLGKLSWDVETLDCMALLGSFEAKVGDWVFRRWQATTSAYDALHFSHFRPGSRLAFAIDRQATKRMVPRLRSHLRDRRADLVVGAFTTGASAGAKLRAEFPQMRLVVLCTDVTLYRLWVWDEVDLFVVTSDTAAASVRRYRPRAPIAVVPPPVRSVFYEAPSQADARAMLGIPPDEGCVLVMGGGWGLGPLEEAARALALSGVNVLAVAGHNARLAEGLFALSAEQPRVTAFGFTDRVPELMAAADAVVTTPGATTCSEARVVGRTLVLVDAVAGHGRENLQHELAQGEAEASDANARSVTQSVLAVLDRVKRPLNSVVRPAGEWDEALERILAEVGLGDSADGESSGGNSRRFPR